MRGRRLLRVALAAAVTGTAALAFGAARSQAMPLPSAPNCEIFPATNVWNKRVDSLPVAANSAAMIDAIGRTAPVHPDFGSFAGYGIPVNVVPGSQPTRRVRFQYASESNPGPYPIPKQPRIEAGSDRHLLIVDRGNCKLYELFDARRTTGAGTPARARSGRSPRTICATWAGRAPMPPDCRSCPASCATPRSRRA